VKYNPHPYQDYATQRILDNKFIGLWLEMGLGKTVSTLTAIDLLLNDYYDATRVLVIAPLRVADDTWAREVEKWDHLKHLRISKILGDAETRRKAMRAEADVYVINRENVPWLVAELGRKWNFDTVVIDESSSFKNPDSKRFRALRRVRPLMKRMIQLTGTPAPNGLMDIWAPIYLLDRGERLHPTLTMYRDQFFFSIKKDSVTKYKQKKEAEGHIYKAISDITVSMKAEDWLDLPEKIDRMVPVTLNIEARALYKQMERDLLIPYLDADVIALTAAVLANKLLQMSSGSVYDEDKGVKHIHDDKLDALEDLIEAANGKPVMVFYNFKHSLARLQQRFPYARLLRKKESKEDIADWNNDEIPLLLLHPKSAGHGLNLQESNCRTVCWFDLTWSLEEYQQANARLHRQGQKHNIVVAHLIATGTMDDEVMAALERKATGQESLMQAVKARIEKVKKG
jgi:SNF2 family DNA or RNA helicase